jgi:hypothetical protein
VPLLDLLTALAGDPQVRQTAMQLYLQARRDQQAAERIARHEQRLAELEQRLAGLGTGTDVAASAVPMPTGGDPLAEARRLAVQVSGDLGEALRFAREDGLEHPEVARRIADARAAEAQLLDLERYQLSPARLLALPPQQRAAAEATLPALRRLRQAVVGMPLRTVDDLTAAAAAAEGAATSLRVAEAVSAAGATPSSPATTAEASDAGSRYLASEGGRDVSTSCVACTRAHLLMAATSLRAAADAAEQGGLATPEVADRLRHAEEELTVLVAHDLTPERVAATPEPERAAVERVAPQVAALLDSVRTARDPAALRRLADEAAALRQGFAAATEATPSLTYALLVGAAGRPHDAAVPRALVDRYTDVLPTEYEVREVTARADPGEMFARLAARLQERGVRIVPAPLESGPEAVNAGNYNPHQNAITLNGALFGLEHLGVRNPFALQTLVHEGAHALKDSIPCLGRAPEQLSPDERAHVESLADAATVLTLAQLGQPVTDLEGTELAGRVPDWDAVRAELSPDDYRTVRWTVDWLVRAAEGADGSLATEQCPALAGAHGM